MKITQHVPPPAPPPHITFTIDGLTFDQMTTLRRAVSYIDGSVAICLQNALTAALTK